MLAIIGGSGLHEALSGIAERAEDTVNTPFGDVGLLSGRMGETPVIFLSRHGAGADVPPHRVNYKANMRALKDKGVERVVAISAVGALDGHIPLGCLALPDQFIDFTKENPTYYEGGDSGRVHIDLSEPFCPELRGLLYEAALDLGYDARGEGTYTCISGPHFETRAEAGMLRMLGGDYAGMTAVPEAKLARELEMCYQVISIPVDYPGEKSGEVSHANTLKLMEESTERVARVIEGVVPRIPKNRGCECPKALERASG